MGFEGHHRDSRVVVRRGWVQSVEVERILNQSRSSWPLENLVPREDH